VNGGDGNEANNNTNTSGDQTAFNGNNRQQTNSSVQNQHQRSGAGRPDYKKEVPIL
jgi:hypothetical protein